MLICWMVFVWLQTCSILTQDIDLGSSAQVSEKELQCLASENDPKCFIRTPSDLTCFWEGKAEHSYHFFYTTAGIGKTLCALTEWTTSNGTILHICLFPSKHVLLFIPTQIWVVDVVTNMTLFGREIWPEEKELPYPPKNISIQRTEEPGQLQVRWKASPLYSYQVQYSYQRQPERKTMITTPSAHSDLFVLTPLAPGEVCSVQMRVRRKRAKGFWSDWSEPAMAMVPQKAEAAGLVCYTSNLYSIQCQWNKQFQMNENTSNEEDSVVFRENMSNEWGDWKICAKDNRTDLRCSFDGEPSADIQVSLQVGSGPLNRTFYTKTFRMYNSIKTEPPRALRGEPEGERLHLQWDPPSKILSQHLIYEIRYRSKDETAWKHLTLQSPKTSTYLNEQAGSQHFIQVKAKPNGSFQGYWSDWSNMLTVDLPSNNWLLLLFIVCIPLVILLLSAVVASVFSRYSSKVKRYLWPPVPKLDKMLESFLAEQPQWDPTFNIKHCDDETPASVVEILSDNPVSCDGTQGTSVCTSLPEGSFHSQVDQKEDGPVVERCLEAGRDYVTLTTEVIPYLRGNEYVYGNISAPCSTEMQRHCENTQTHSSAIPGLTTTSMLNHSYQLLPGRTDSWENDSETARYTNLDAAVMATA